MNRRTVGLTAALVALLVVVTGLLVEGVLRTYASLAYTDLAEALRADPYAVLVEPHGEVGYRPRPGSVHRYDNGTAARVNAMAFRGPTVQVPKPRGTVRILLFGGSTTFGWGVDDDDTIGRHMERILAARHPDLTVEVVNLAFDGYDSYQLLERLRSDGVRLEPDVVIVNSGVNDVSHAWFRDLQAGDPRTLLYRGMMEQIRREEARGAPEPWTRAKHWLYSARFASWMVRQIGLLAEQSAAQERALPEPYWDLLDYFEGNLVDIVEVAGRAGASKILLSTPPSSLLTRYPPDAPPQRHYWIRDAQTTQVYRDSLSVRAQRVAETHEAPEVQYVSHGELSPELFLDDAHLTPEGNRRVAEDFADALDPWLSELAATSGPAG